jgi:hypothetical protein
MARQRSRLVLLVGVISLLLLSSTSYAIPAFSRQYGTSCSTCHLDFPKLNDFGKAFKDAGFKFPKDDESFLKIPPVMLGAPAQKDLWPHAIWPGTIPGLPPIGLRMNNFFQVVSRNRNTFNNLLPPGTVGPFTPRTDFQTGLFSIFTAGNFGSDIAFWVDDDFSIGGDNSNGGLGDGYLKFVDIGRFLKLPQYALSLRAGQFELDIPFTQARSINLSGYDIYDEANIGAMNSLFPQQNVNNAFAFSGAAQGVELSGGRQYRGYHYSVALVNQNTSGNTNSPANISPVNGVAFQSDANFKDVYSRFSYRFNLEKDPASRNEIQAAGTTGPRDHTYLTLGSYYFYGRSVQRFTGALADLSPAVQTAREPFYRTGGDFSFNYRTFNIYGLFMYGHDHNLLPVVFTPPGSDTPLVLGFNRNRAATFSGGFIQADYLVLPWVMAIMRYDAVNSSADQINGLLLGSGPSTPFLSPFRTTRNRFTPGVQFLIHANIKASFEYQIRPEQTITVATNPITGLPTAANPFRTNTAVVGLEFVY